MPTLITHLPHSSTSSSPQHWLKQARLPQNNTKSLQLPSWLWGILSHLAALGYRGPAFLTFTYSPCFQFSHRKGFDFSQII